MLKFDFNNVTPSAIGEKGLDLESILSKENDRLRKAFDAVILNKGKGWQEWCYLPAVASEVIDEIIAYTDEIRRKASDFVVFGIGGSALGPMAVATALLHQKHNLLPKEKRKAPRLFVEDNIDPTRMQSLLDVIDLRNAYFNIVTKSGETSETLAQFLIVYDLLIQKLGKEEAKKRIIVTTTIGKGALYETAQKEGFKTYGVGKGVGGRFSVLSAVGLITFGVMGLNIKSLLKGALNMGVLASKPDFWQNPVFLSALIQTESLKRGKNISVMMPYSDALRYMSDFYAQIWGESLGKAVDNTGAKVYVGQTPVKALGVTDQHSQVQLYTEGPFDKVVTFISVEDFGQEVVIPKMYKDAAVNTQESVESDLWQKTDDNKPTVDGIACGAFMANVTMNKLLNAERVATEFALTKAKRANFNIIFPKINEESVGELLAYYMYQTAFAGALLNIDTFNQPGVEEGKLATFAMLGRPGYEEKLHEIRSKIKDRKYILG